MSKKIMRSLQEESKSTLSGNGLLYEEMAVRFAYIVLVFSLLLTGMNIYHGYSFMTLTTTILSLGALAAALLYQKNQYDSGTILLILIILSMFTVYALTEQNDGFAILWIILLPPISLWLVGIKKGVFICLYFTVLLIVIFYTPLRANFDRYTSTFMDRFPLLYLCSASIALFIMYEYHKIQSRQQNYQVYLEKVVQAERKKVADISLQTILSISNAVDAKDKYTNQHSIRVAAYARAIAKKLGWDNEQIDQLNMIALLHDIGKIGIKDAILNKPDKLTDEEYEIMKQHTTIGAKILKELTILPNVSYGAKYHHERYDGKGYPNGLAGEDIPIEARIICIADAYDTMNSDRAYRAACDEAYIRQELINGKGTQFDPALVDVFLSVLEQQKEYSRNSGNCGSEAKPDAAILFHSGS